MSSILTNSAATIALQGARATQAALAQTQNRVATGLKISTAADKSSTWSIAETMKSDRGVASAITDSLGVGSQMLAVALSGVERVITVMNDIKSLVAQAAQAGSDTGKIAASLIASSAQMRSIVAASTFDGVNLLDGSQTNIRFTAGYVDGKGAGSSLTNVDFTPTKLFALKTITTTNRLGAQFVTTYDTGVLAADDSKIFNNFTWTNETDPTGAGLFMSMQDAVGYSINTGGSSYSNYFGFADIVESNNAQYAQMLASGHYASTLTAADLAIANLTDYAARLGSTKSMLDTQHDFMRSLGEALDQGVGSLVDADANEESTRLQALQTRQQLAAKSMSIANQNSQIILRLFQAA
ncbi:flagellin N-terminal helical domain-containing protein [Methylosinus sp. LW4]|uniref:flagellin N-terminal helical domain-containing protein n=1 Tax=Methylosinus sp. LW4 TaxID=136993 RepID=UPI000377B943|nr:flagellin [Methylosinus sp. LW4]